MKSQYLRENIVSMNQEEDVILEKKKECLENKREILEIFLNDGRNTMHKNFKDKQPRK